MGSAEPAHTMRATTILVLLAALCVASTLATTHDPLTGVFAKWMSDNSKSYSNEEFVFRWNVWKENQQLIDEHNRSNQTFFLAMNKFGDLTNAEFNKLFKGLAFDYSLHANMSPPRRPPPPPACPPISIGGRRVPSPTSRTGVSAARAGRSRPPARLRAPTSSRPAVSPRSPSRTSSIAPARTATTAATVV